MKNPYKDFPSNKHSKKNNKHSYLIYALIVLGFIALMPFLSWAMDRQEAYDCAKWADQANKFDGFFYADWQAEQCGIQVTEEGFIIRNYTQL